MQVSIEPVKHEIDHKNCEMLGDIIVKVTRSAPFPGRLIFRSATGMSLPNNQDVVSSLFARLAGSCLVTTLVVFSEIYFPEDMSELKNKGPREIITTIPLYTPFGPLLWREERCHWKLREWLNDLRYHFFLLLGWDKNDSLTTEQKHPVP
ncbi:hypothetical protein BKA82DRAFT_2871994 [Pisolithus tinctorius]|nr:hypothetical protein BKA82DRAFT_2871994 [Pisolithus tinctorius]